MPTPAANTSSTASDLRRASPTAARCRMSWSFRGWPRPGSGYRRVPSPSPGVRLASMPGEPGRLEPDRADGSAALRGGRHAAGSIQAWRPNSIRSQPVIEVVDPGRYTSIQDRGRPGFERFGIPPGGAVDWLAASVANRLVGNEPDAALIEATTSGPTLRFQSEATIAVTGGHCPDAGFPSWRAHRVDAGFALDLGRVSPGLRTYVAVRGGIEVPLVLGSRSL